MIKGPVVVPNAAKPEPYAPLTHVTAAWLQRTDETSAARVDPPECCGVPIDVRRDRTHQALHVLAFLSVGLHEVLSSLDIGSLEREE